jgi:hypothetical protein
MLRSYRSRCLAMDTRSDSDIPAFRRHATIYIYIYIVYTRVYDDVNLLGDNIDTIKKNAATSIDASREVGLEVNAERTLSIYCCLVTRMQSKIMT